MSEFNSSVDSTVPTASEFFSRLTNKYSLVLALSTVLTIINVIIYVTQVARISSRVSDTTRRALLGYLSGTPAFVSTASLVALYAPRMHFFSYMMSFLYFIGAFYAVTQLFWVTIGSRDSVAPQLKKGSPKIKLNTPPFCCCLPCLPQVEMIAKNIIRIEWLVLQALIVRTIITIVFFALYFEYGERSFVWNEFIDVGWIPFFFLAIYGCHLLAANVASSEKVKRSNCIAFFRLTDLFMLFYGIQQPIFQAITDAGKFNCDILPMANTGFFWKNMASVIEAFLISLLIMLFVKPAKESSGDFEPIASEISMAKVEFGLEK